MKRITKTVLLVSGLVSLASVAGIGFQAVAQAGDDNTNTLAFDEACDCRTFTPQSPPARGGPFIVNGKIFPAGTLPSGAATNDPTQPVNGVASIGNWICRDQPGTPFPAAIASAYATAPIVLNTQYYLLNDGRGLTLEGYELPNGGAALSVTGGVGAFLGASGAAQYPPGVTLGTNITGCPNFRTVFRIRPGALRGASDN
jgi:hypothetical protein